jgi:hypothetical protein
MSSWATLAFSKITPLQPYGWVPALGASACEYKTLPSSLFFSWLPHLYFCERPKVSTKNSHVWRSVCSWELVQNVCDGFWCGWVAWFNVVATSKDLLIVLMERVPSVYGKILVHVDPLWPLCLLYPMLYKPFKLAALFLYHYPLLAGFQKAFTLITCPSLAVRPFFSRKSPGHCLWFVCFWCSGTATKRRIDSDDVWSGHSCDYPRSIERAG